MSQYVTIIRSMLPNLETSPKNSLSLTPSLTHSLPHSLTHSLTHCSVMSSPGLLGFVFHESVLRLLRGFSPKEDDGGFLRREVMSHVWRSDEQKEHGMYTWVLFIKSLRSLHICLHDSLQQRFEKTKQIHLMQPLDSLEPLTSSWHSNAPPSPPPPRCGTSSWATWAPPVDPRSPSFAPPPCGWLPGSAGVASAKRSHTTLHTPLPHPSTPPFMSRLTVECFPLAPWCLQRLGDSDVLWRPLCPLFTLLHPSSPISMWPSPDLSASPRFALY